MTVGVLGVEEPEEASELAEAELLAFWLEELEEDVYKRQRPAG